ncbi:CotH kinase family protein [Flavobacterium sp.]|uniref:CotH kinase family protein n=1 Tax=Flavobacterium sp. TaxID=239 RepID=UPI00286EA68B|nr:CotH kinase family protein [Flavobacterium sp.]
MKNNYSKTTTLFFQFLFFFLFINTLNAQFTDSNLPIVIINTDIDPVSGMPLEIPDDPRVLGTMKIIKHTDGSRNYLTDQNTTAFLNYNGRINIEIRGSTSQLLPKKPYGLSTLQANGTSNNNVSLLGMPAENDWILNAIAYDPSLIRDYLCYNLSRQIGQYASRTEYCEVVVNGVYKGLYILQEKIKSNSDRVNIVKIATLDITLPNLTGGYITKADKTTGGDPIAWTMGETNFIHELPKPTDVTPEQDAYIEGEFNKLALNTYNQSLFNGYTSVIDVPSFVDFMLVNELSSNADVYQSSTFFHKDRSGKLRAGPVWDLNQTFGSTFTSSSHVNQWQFDNGNRVGPEFWFELTDNGTFWCYFSKRWNDMTQPGKPMELTSINSFIDATITKITEASVREHALWNTIPNLPNEIITFKSWISQRMTWINNNVGPFSSCANVVTPPLVISKINYNPSTSTSFPVSNDQEFIEIKNTGFDSVNLSGIYFRELGTTYQFPYNATIAANGSLFLASNPTVFFNKYGIVAFDQYTRNFSNKSQKIVLADAFGNVIDSVEYFDTSPWPTAADGSGSYLELTDVTLDNNLASSWIASTNALLYTNQFNTINTSLFPNPVVDVVTIQSNQELALIEIFDISGKKVHTAYLNSNRAQINMSNMMSGFYIVKILDSNGKMETQKIVKQ